MSFLRLHVSIVWWSRLGVLGWILSTALPAGAAPIKNVIVMIGDGMGSEQVIAAGMYLNGAAGTLNFESFPNQAMLTTASANSSVTDSAAAATAIATGVQVNNGVR